MSIQNMNALIGQVEKLSAQLDKRCSRYQLLERYFDGATPMPVAVTEAKVTRAYRRLMPVADAPWGSLIVGSVTDRLELGGLRDKDGGDADQVWSLWQQNRMNSESALGHITGLMAGRVFATVWPDANDQPEISLDSPEQMIVQYEEGSRYHRRAALRRWKDVDTGKTMATLYRPDGIFKFTEADDPRGEQASWVMRQEPDDDGWPVVNPWGVVPVVEVRFNPRLKAGQWGYARGEYEHCCGLIDRINLLTFIGLVVAFWQGFPVRAVIGDRILRDDDGQVIPPFDVKADSIIQLENPQAKLASFAAADRSNLLIYPELAQLAAITKTPRHYFPLAQAMANLPLAVDTVVPTPSGRTTMGDLKVGDTIYAPDGNTVRVTEVLPIRYGRECFRMTFDDGAEIVADGDHKWETKHFLRPDSNPYRHGTETSVVTTAEIAKTLLTCQGKFNHYIPTAAAHEGPTLKYPVAPYALGAWLGDGGRHIARLDSHITDADAMADRLRACGEVVSVYGYPESDEIHRDTRLIGLTKDKEKCPRGHSRARGTKTDTAKCATCDHLHYRRRRYGEPMPEKVNETFIARLKQLGVWKNKHIPEEYFRGSAEQRLELLRGVMDTDGSVNPKSGGVALTLHDERLARDVQRLARSLGHKVKLRRTEWRRRGGGLVGAGSGICWRMSWTPRHIVFNMKRKADHQRLPTAGGRGRSTSPFGRYIVACEPTESVPVRCINVASEEHLFCVTDAFIATRNSADAIRADEGALNAKVTDHKKYAGEDWLEVARLLALQADLDLSPAAELWWIDHESRSLAERADAATKLSGILPWQALAEVVLNASQDTISRWESMRASDALSQLLTAVKQPVDANGGVGPTGNAVPDATTPAPAG